MTLPRPTALGYKALAFYVVVTGAFFAAPYSNLLFLLVAFLTVLGVVSVWWAVRNVWGVRACVGELQPTAAGTGALCHATLDVGSRHRVALEVAVELDQGSVCRMVAGVQRPRRVKGDKAGRSGFAADADDEVQGQFPAVPRGVYRVRRARVRSCWPSGLWLVECDVRTPEDLVVHPAPVAAGDPGPGGGAGEDPMAEALAAQGSMQPSALREYRSGDEPRQVHWRATARRGALVITEWEAGRGTGFEAVLDRRGDADTLERNLSVLAALALQARDEKEALTLHTQGLSRTFDATKGGLRELWQFLAAIEGLPADGPAPPPASPDVLVLDATGGGHR